MIQANLVSLVKTAWAESPSLAVQLLARFPSAKLHQEIRWNLKAHPEKALSEPEALEILLDGALPNDLSTQLQV